MVSLGDRFSIRQLTPDDWEILRDMRLRSLRMHPGYFLGEYEKAEDYTKEEWQETLNGDNKAIFGLFDRNNIIGITAIFMDKDDPSGLTGVLAYNFIEPAFRGLGLSDFFYEARIKWAEKNTNWTSITTGHRIDNMASQAAILRNGFELEGKKMRLWPDGQTKAELIYKLRLKRSSSGQVVA